jgi:hypothetical protein
LARLKLGIFIYIYIGSTNTVEFYFTLNDRMTVIVAKRETVSMELQLPTGCLSSPRGYMSEYEAVVE